MNEPRSVVDAVVRALEEVVESSREARCQQLTEDARRRAQEIVKTAHRENRARMRTAIDQQRESMEEALATTRARLSTRARERLHHVDRDRLERARARLGEVLLERWQDTDSRQRWILGLIESALSYLPGGTWRIEHPGDFDLDDLAGVNERIALHCGGNPPDFAVRDSARVGLRIAVDGAVLDGTMEGLLADRTRIDAELLASLRLDDGDEVTP